MRRNSMTLKFWRKFGTGKKRESFVFGGISVFCDSNQVITKWMVDMAWSKSD